MGVCVCVDMCVVVSAYVINTLTHNSVARSLAMQTLFGWDFALIFLYYFYVLLCKQQLKSSKQANKHKYTNIFTDDKFKRH